MLSLIMVCGISLLIIGLLFLGTTRTEALPAQNQPRTAIGKAAYRHYPELNPSGETITRQP